MAQGTFLMLLTLLPNQHLPLRNWKVVTGVIMSKVKRRGKREKERGTWHNANEDGNGVF